MPVREESIHERAADEPGAAGDECVHASEMISRGYAEWRLDVGSPMKRVLITGAAGGVGHRIAAVLRQHGFDVRGLVRPGDDIRRLALPAENIISGYVQDAASVGPAMDGVDAVVHCAAILPDGGQSFRQVQEVNVDGTRIVMQEAAARGVKRVFAMSTISVVDHVTRAIGPGDLFDYVTDTVDPYLTSKIAAERLLLDMRRSYSGELSLLRLAYVYGPGNFAVWRRPLAFLEQGTLRLLNDGSAPFPLIYADDIGSYIIALLDGELSRGYDGVHILASPQPTTLRNVFDFIADYLDVPRPRSAPLWVAQLGASAVTFVPRRFRVGRLEMLTRARVQQFSRGYDLTRVLQSRELEGLRMTDYKDGLRSMLSDYVASERASSARRP